MDWSVVVALSASGVVTALAGFVISHAAPSPGAAAPIYGVTLPDGYRDWRLVGVAQETGTLDELRAVVGNAVALDAYRAGSQPFPDGTVLVKLAWQHRQSKEFVPAFVPGAATTVQVMVKGSKRYPDSGGWGFGRFVGGVPVDERQHRICFAGHEAKARGQDYVFTRYAP